MIRAADLDIAFSATKSAAFNKFLKEIDMPTIVPSKDTWKPICAHLHQHYRIPWSTYKQVLSEAFQQRLPTAQKSHPKTVYTHIIEELTHRRIHDPYIYNYMPVWMKRKVLAERKLKLKSGDTITQTLVDMDQRDGGAYRAEILNVPEKNVYVYGAMMDLNYMRLPDIAEYLADERTILRIIYMALTAVPLAEIQPHRVVQGKSTYVRSWRDLIAETRLGNQVTADVPRLKQTFSRQLHDEGEIANLIADKDAYICMIDAVDLENYELTRTIDVVSSWVLSGYVQAQDRKVYTKYISSVRDIPRLYYQRLFGMLFYGYPLDGSALPNPAPVAISSRNSRPNNLVYYWQSTLGRNLANHLILEMPPRRNSGRSWYHRLHCKKLRN